MRLGVVGQRLDDLPAVPDAVNRVGSELDLGAVAGNGHDLIGRQRTGSDHDNLSRLGDGHASTPFASSAARSNVNRQRAFVTRQFGRPAGKTDPPSRTPAPASASLMYLQLMCN